MVLAMPSDGASVWLPAAAFRSGRLRSWPKLGLRVKFVLLAVLLVLLSGGGAGLAGWDLADRLISSAADERLDAAARTFASLYNQRVAEAEIVAHQLTTRAQLPGQVRQGNADAVYGLLAPIQELRPQFTIAAARIDGDVVAKVVPEGGFNPGQSILGVPGSDQALAGRATTTLLRRADCQLAVVVTTPIGVTPAQRVGAVLVSFPLDELFVQQVKADTGLELSLYCGDALVATTFPSRKRVPETMADVGVIRRVLEHGEVLQQEVRVANQQLRAQYVPLRTLADEIAGMYAVGIPVRRLVDERVELLLAFAPAIATIALVAMVLGYLGANALTAPLRRLAQAAARIGQGELDTTVAIEGEDEVAALATRMEEMRRSVQQTYAHLRELNRLKEEYLFSVAHEVRTPLASVVASVEILAADFDRMSGADLEATVRRVERSVTRLNTLVQNVLDAGSIRVGRFTVHPQPSSLQDAIEQAMSAIQPVLAEKRQQIQSAVPERLPPVLADERRIAQVLTNLFSNAGKYGPEADQIVVGAASSDGYVRITVSDHGPGVPLPEQGELFERYFRAATTARTSPGTGLGLAVSKAIVEAHGGQIGLESEPDRGTTVWFTLPRADHQARAA